MLAGPFSRQVGKADRQHCGEEFGAPTLDVFEKSAGKRR